MSITLEDLKPKTFTVTIKGVELQCKPLRLSHALTVQKVGEVFSNVDTVDAKDILQAQRDLDNVIYELIPELKGIELDVTATAELMGQLQANTEPADSKELQKEGVQLNADPKVTPTSEQTG